MGKLRVYAVWGLLGLAIANWSAWGIILEQSSLRVAFFDIGQGDAIFIQTPEGHRILIDGGPNKAIAEKIGKTLPFWSKRIDLILLTHPDADHITGLVTVLEQYEVEHVVWTGEEHNSGIFAAWKKSLKKEGARVTLARAPQRIAWSKNSSRAFMDIVFPAPEDIMTIRSLNGLSIVSRLVFANHAFLFTGDIEKTGEQKMADRGVNLRANVLKAAHHGSKTSSSESFLAAVSPSLAVMQVGANNRYGHPAPEVLARFAALGIPVLRNDLNGDIVVQSDGAAIRVH